MANHLIKWFCDNLWRRIDPQTQFFHIQLDITNACNLRCDHCYCPDHQNEGALTLNEWHQVLDQYENLLNTLYMTPNVTLCGGEPTTSPFLIPLLEDIRRRFPTCDLSVQSNGTLITEEVVLALKRLSVFLQISIDGPDAERHDIIRGKGSFDKTMGGCQVLNKYGVPFYHQAVLSHRTQPWIGDFFQTAKRTRATDMNFTRFISKGHAEGLVKEGKDAPLTGLALKKAYEEILQASQDSGIPTRTSGELWCLIKKGLGSPNNTGFNGIVIGYRGEVKVTSRTLVAIGNVKKDDICSLFLNHPTMRRLRKGDFDICGTCQYFSSCRGNRNVSFAEHGHFFGWDTGCWVKSNDERE